MFEEAREYLTQKKLILINLKFREEGNWERFDSTKIC